jgi:hypothetical protein
LKINVFFHFDSQWFSCISKGEIEVIFLERKAGKVVIWRGRDCEIKITPRNKSRSDTVRNYNANQGYRIEVKYF